MIMKITVQDDDNRKLFLGVNADHVTGGHIFTFTNDVATEATDMAVYFGSYLVYKHSENIPNHIVLESPQAVASPINNGRKINDKLCCNC